MGLTKGSLTEKIDSTNQITYKQNDCVSSGTRQKKNKKAKKL